MFLSQPTPGSPTTGLPEFLEQRAGNNLSNITFQHNINISGEIDSPFTSSFNSSEPFVHPSSSFDSTGFSSISNKTKFDRTLNNKLQNPLMASTNQIGGSLPLPNISSGMSNAEEAGMPRRHASLVRPMS